jgi:hypothetical protein
MFTRPQSQPVAGCGGVCQSSQTMWEAETWRIMAPGQPGQKNFPSQWIQAGHGVACLSSQ